MKGIVKNKFIEVHNKLSREIDYFEVSIEVDGETQDLNKTFTHKKIRAILNAPNERYDLLNRGLTQNAKLKIFVLPTVPIKRDDEIEVDDVRYRVDNPTTHNWNDEPIYTSVDLFLIEDYQR